MSSYSEILDALPPDDEDELEQEARLISARFGRCPACDKAGLIAGPWGGMSRNVFCGGCMARWTFHGIPHGIVRVDFNGEASETDIDHARVTYAADQPFAPTVKLTIDDCAAYSKMIGQSIRHFLPEGAKILCIAFDNEGRMGVVTDVADQDRVVILKSLIERFELGHMRYAKET